MSIINGKKLAVVGGLVGIIAVGAVGGFLYQPSEKTDKIYSQALSDYNEGKYQNAYYLFSKVSFASQLKPTAIFHQGECARMLDDNQAAAKQYSFLFNNYPQSPLSVRSRYLAGEQLIDIDSVRAKKYFQSIIKKNPDTEYAIASEYYLGQIIVKKYTADDGTLRNDFSRSEKTKAENSFRHYLTQAPSGRHALNAVKTWLSLGVEINPDDYLLMAKTAYIFADYKKAQELLEKSQIAESWPTLVKNSKMLGDYSQVRYYTEEGLSKYSKYVDEKEVTEAIDAYLSLEADRSTAISRLISMTPDLGADYLMSEQCKSYSGSAKEGCYNSLYLKYPNGNYAADALSNIFFAKLKSHDYGAAKRVGMDHLKKFPDSNSAPMVMFWLAKISENSEGYDVYSKHYNALISKYPDTYYAYRAFLRLNHYNNPLIVKDIYPKPVEYPYKYANKNLIVKLVELNDYDIVNELCKDDEFIKSWVLYKRGDYTHSAITARNAMDKLEVKPDKYDLRWRLVYPIHYYEEVKQYADLVGNNAPLMLALLKEESHFDPLAQSSVGASGLMQLMPSTAEEIARKHGIIRVELFNPEDNIRLGNFYYADVRSMLSGFDVSAVAAYNGGIGSVNRWKASLYYNDTDDFVEQIPYCETKNYVKKVFRSYWNYIRIYTGNS